jgi:hypothetical protein
MAHYAKVANGFVEQVIVAEQDVIDSGVFGDGWIQTSYNTFGGQHPEGRPLRKNYAGVGYLYDAQRDAFIPPQPYPSWTLNEQTCLWDCPVPNPNDGKIYLWDEVVLNWVLPENLTQTTAEYISNVTQLTLTSSDSVNGADSISGGADSVNGAT